MALGQKTPLIEPRCNLVRGSLRLLIAPAYSFLMYSILTHFLFVKITSGSFLEHSQQKIYKCIKKNLAMGGIGNYRRAFLLKENVFSKKKVR